jgi:DNA-binding response OmpR family regulator
VHLFVARIDEMQKPEVLVVEDEAGVAMLLEEALDDADFSVTVAHHAADADRHLDSGSGGFDAIVSDIRLKGEDRDGWDVVRHAREISRDIAVVYVSATDGGEWLVRGVPESVFIQKPFVPAQVVTAVAILLNGATPSG